jgi:hypothetical protein
MMLMVVVLLLQLLLLLLQVSLGEKEVRCEAQQRDVGVVVSEGGGGRGRCHRRHVMVEGGGREVVGAGVVGAARGSAPGRHGQRRLLHVLLELLHVPLELGPPVLEPADHLQQEEEGRILTRLP